MEYKEGKDFEWVPMKDKNGKVVKDGRGGAVKTRRFFTKAEKEAMKSGDKPKAKPKSKPKSSVSSSAPKSTTTKPQARRTEGQIRSSSGGRTRYTPTEFTNDGGPRRGSVKPEKKTRGGLSISANVYPKTEKVPNPEDSVKVGSLTVTPSQRLSDAGKRIDSYRVSKENKSINGVTFDEWRKLSRSERVEKNLPLTNQEFMRAMRLKGKTSGMFNGGMVKSGNKDYKKSGMFYQSGSPRGYK